MNLAQKSLLIILILLTSSALALAQDDTCPAIVEQALNTVEEVCESAGRNQACYGHNALVAEARPDARNFNFDSAGDIVNVADVERLALSPLDVDTSTWGVAVMRLQVNLPDTLPGQNVTFLLFGDVEITAADGDPDQPPMQAFYLKTGIGDAPCEDAPESGLLVQTPEGVGEVTFTVNEVNVSLGSTVYFQTDPEHDEMIVSTLEGHAFLERAGKIQAVVAGTRLRLPLIRDGIRARVADLSDEIEPYNERLLKRLPLRLLKRHIEIERPLTLVEIRLIRERIRSGEPLCGFARLPACAAAIPLPDTDVALPETIPTLPSLPSLPRRGG